MLLKYYKPYIKWEANTPQGYAEYNGYKFNLSYNEAEKELRSWIKNIEGKILEQTVKSFEEKIKTEFIGTVSENDYCPECNESVYLVDEININNILSYLEGRKVKISIEILE